MTKYITEILQECNQDPSKLPLYKNNSAITTLLAYAFDPDLKFDLPEGMPPHKGAAEPLGMTEANFYAQMRKLYVFTRQDINKVRRETIFIQLCEGLHPTEVLVLCAVKDQTLTKLYPNLTRKVLEEAGMIRIVTFPGGVEPVTETPADTLLHTAGESTVTVETADTQEGQHLVLGLGETLSVQDKVGNAPAAPSVVVTSEVTMEPTTNPLVEQPKRGRGRPPGAKNKPK